MLACTKARIATYLKKGFRVIGFEADPILAEHCRSRFSDEVENGRLIVVNAAIVELPDGLTKAKQSNSLETRSPAYGAPLSIAGHVEMNYLEQEMKLLTSML